MILDLQWNIEMKLIKIEVQKPEMDQEVLFKRNGDFHVGCYWGELEGYENKPVFQDINSGMTFDDVTHWCELPSE